VGSGEGDQAKAWRITIFKLITQHLVQAVRRVGCNYSVSTI
jgi:hypothetical protein